MILLALAKTDKIRGDFEKSSINTKRTTIFIHSLLPSTTYFPEAKLSSTFHPSIFWKYSKTNHQQPEYIQRHFRLQICLSRKSPISRKYSKTLRQSAAAMNSSNQQQQKSAVISSSKRQHQTAAAEISIHPTSSTYTIHDDLR